MKRLALVCLLVLASAAALPQEVITALRHPHSSGGGGVTFVKTTTSSSSALSYTCTTGDILYFVADNNGANPAVWPSASSSTDALTTVSGSNQGGAYQAQVKLFTATCGGTGTRTVSWSGGNGGTLYSAVAEFSSASATVVTSGVGGAGYTGSYITVSGTNGSGGSFAIFGYGSANGDLLTSCGGGFVSAGGIPAADIWYSTAMPSGAFSFNCNLTTGSSTDTWSFASFLP